MGTDIIFCSIMRIATLKLHCSFCQVKRLKTDRGKVVASPNWQRSRFWLLAAGHWPKIRFQVFRLRRIQVSGSRWKMTDPGKYQRLEDNLADT